jgi:hypothetical protein
MQNPGNIIDQQTGEVVLYNIDQMVTAKKTAIDSFVENKKRRLLAKYPDMEDMSIGQMLIASTGMDAIKCAKLHSEYTGTMPYGIDQYLNSKATIVGCIIEDHEAFQGKDGEFHEGGYNYLLMLTDDFQDSKVDGQIVKVRKVIKTSGTQPVRLMKNLAMAYGWGIFSQPVTISFSGSKADGYFARLYTQP